MKSIDNITKEITQSLLEDIITMENKLPKEGSDYITHSMYLINFATIEYIKQKFNITNQDIDNYRYLKKEKDLYNSDAWW